MISIALAVGESIKGLGYSPVTSSIARSTDIGKVVVASLNGELVIKRYRMLDGKAFLFSENKDFEPIPLREDHELVIWGVVVHCIHTI